MTKKDIIIIGASGFAKEVLWLIREINKITNEWNILGFIDSEISQNKDTIHGYKVIGDDNWLLSYKEPIYVTCGIGSPKHRARIMRKFESKSNIEFPNLIFPGTLVADGAAMGKGCIICANNVISVDSRLGDFVTINIGCVVGHDAVLKDYVTLNPNVNISGNVFVETETDLGTGSKVIQGINVGKHTIVGAGAVVIRDIPDYCTAVGNPAKVIKINEPLEGK